MKVLVNQTTMSRKTVFQSTTTPSNTLIKKSAAKRTNTYSTKQEPGFIERVKDFLKKTFTLLLDSFTTTGIMSGDSWLGGAVHFIKELFKGVILINC